MMQTKFLKKAFILLCIIFTYFLAGCGSVEKQTVENHINNGDQRTSIIQDVDDLFPGAYGGNYELDGRSITCDTNNYYYITEHGIVKQNKETAESELILSEANVSSIVLYNSKIYFNVSLCIKSIDTNGNNIETVFDYTDKKYNKERWKEDEAGMGGFTIHNGVFYIANSGISMFQFNPSTGKTYYVLDDVSPYAFNGDYVSYSKHADRNFTIYRKNLITYQEERILGDGKYKKHTTPESNAIWYDDVLFVGDKMYYTTRITEGLWEYNPDGEDKRLYNHQPDVFSEYQGNIYFVVGENLYKLDVNTNETTFIQELKDFSSYGFQIVDHYLFFDIYVDDKDEYYSKLIDLNDI